MSRKKQTANASGWLWKNTLLSFLLLFTSLNSLQVEWNKSGKHFLEEIWEASPCCGHVGLGARHACHSPADWGHQGPQWRVPCSELKPFPGRVATRLRQSRGGMWIEYQARSSLGTNQSQASAAMFGNRWKRNHSQQSDTRQGHLETDELDATVDTCFNWCATITAVAFLVFDDPVGQEGRLATMTALRESPMDNIATRCFTKPTFPKTRKPIQFEMSRLPPRAIESLDHRHTTAFGSVQTQNANLKMKSFSARCLQEVLFK